MMWVTEWEPGWSQRSQTVALLVCAAIPCPSTNPACMDSIHPQEMTRAAPSLGGILLLLQLPLTALIGT